MYEQYRNSLEKTLKDSGNNMPGELVLVSGATGFIATHIVQQLQQAGYRVRGTVRSLSNEQKVKPLRELCTNAKYPLELVEADLLDPASWPAAVKDCKYVLHTASPFPSDMNPNDDIIIKPAVEGTLNVLRAVQNAKCVKRVVVTSSMAAIQGSLQGETKIYTEDDWTDPNEQFLPAYMKSKTLAEKAAWDFVNSITDPNETFELATINPGFVIGPALCGSITTSMQLPKQLLTKEMTTVSKVIYPIVDVRDVAKAHVVAMTLPEAAGKRHIATAKAVWFTDVAQWLIDEFNPQGYEIQAEKNPVQSMKEIDANNSRMVNVLKIQPILPRRSYIDMTYSMIENGMIPKSPQYRGPSKMMK